MLTLKVITEETDDVIRRLAKKHFDGKQIIGEIIDLDKKRRSTQQELDTTKAESNQLAKQIGALMKEGKKDEAEAAKAKTSELKEKSKKLEENLTSYEQEITNRLLVIPNLPNELVPEGTGAEDNLVVKEGGPMPNLGADALPHWELAKKYDIIDSTSV